MPRRAITASDREALIRLASKMRLGNDDRRVILRILVAKEDEFAKYKGKTYRLLWFGPTAYGHRTRLQFLDGSKDFWVDSKLVDRSTRGPGSNSKGGRCRECGGVVRNAPHHRAMGGYCGYCAFDEFDS